ncbi:hypothetical protein J6590_000720 [Homalodisca vitripennis]|nr:hypothetical protein J6590_000720 [Homalodisca vitripennis]
MPNHRRCSSLMPAFILGRCLQLIQGFQRVEHNFREIHMYIAHETKLRTVLLLVIEIPITLLQRGDSRWHWLFALIKDAMGPPVEEAVAPSGDRVEVYRISSLNLLWNALK